MYTVAKAMITNSGDTFFWSEGIARKLNRITFRIDADTGNKNKTEGKKELPAFVKTTLITARPWCFWPFFGLFYNNVAPVDLGIIKVFQSFKRGFTIRHFGKAKALALPGLLIGNDL